MQVLHVCIFWQLSPSHLIIQQKVFLSISKVTLCGPSRWDNHSPEGQSLIQHLEQSWCDANTHTYTYSELGAVPTTLLVGGCHLPKSLQKQEESHTLAQKGPAYTCVHLRLHTQCTHAHTNNYTITAYLCAYMFPLHSTHSWTCTQNRYVYVLHNHTHIHTTHTYAQLYSHTPLHHSTQTCRGAFPYLGHPCVHTLLLTHSWPGSPLCSGFDAELLGPCGHLIVLWE